MALDFSFLMTETSVGDGRRYVDWLLQGLGWTLLISISAWCIALVLGVVMGIFRTLPSKLARALGTVYVEVFRNIPLLLQLFLWFYVLPELLPERWGEWLKKDLNASVTWTNFFSEYIFSSIGLGFYTAARVAEQFRAGIQSIPMGQTLAAQSLGLTLFQRYRLLLIPQAARIAWPVLTSECLTVFKNSSLAMTIGLLELTGQTRQISDYTFRTFEVFLVSTLLYIFVSLVVTFIMRSLEHKMMRS